MSDAAAILRSILASLTEKDRNLLKEKRKCFTPCDWSQLISDRSYLVVMLAIARTNFQ